MRGIFAAVALFGLMLALPARADLPAAARQPVETLSQTLLETMRAADTLGFEGRRDKLAPVLRRTFDFPFMARVAAGRHWSRLSPAQRDRLAEQFAAMSIATYAARFDGYSGQSFDVQEPQRGPQNAVIVPSRLVKPDGTAVALDYRMRQDESGAWRIVDVYLKGRFSELASKRSEYTSVLANHGFADLIARLEQRIAELEAGGDG